MRIKDGLIIVVLFIVATFGWINIIGYNGTPLTPFGKAICVFCKK